MTGLDDEDVALESLREGAQDYLVKQADIRPLLSCGESNMALKEKRSSDLLKNAGNFDIICHFNCDFQ
jgi:PleD family two-component response regulator